MMNTHTVIEDLTHLDFEHSPVCDCTKGEPEVECDRPAWAIFVGRCRTCKLTARGYVCSPCWVGAGRIGTICRGCETFAERDQTLRIVRVIG